MQLNLFKPNPTKEFQKVCNILSSINTINDGGCGIAALTMYRHLKQYNLHRNIVFVYEYDQNQRIDDFDTNTAVSPTHVYLSYTYNDLFDCNGEIKQSYRLYTTKRFSNSEEYLLRCINDAEWNYMFNREHYVPMIQKKTGIDLSDVKL